MTTMTFFMPKLLLQVSVRELHNIMMIPIEEDGTKEARDKERILSSVIQT